MALKFGYIGAGQMASAFARGLGEPALFSDSGSGRAQSIAAELGGSALAATENAKLADVLVLAHKPAQLESVAEELSDYAGPIISLLAGTTLDALRGAYPDARIMRTMPNIPVEIGKGVVAVAQESDPMPELDAVLARLGVIVRCPEAELGLVTAVSGCAPAFFAEFAQALADAAVNRGLDAELANSVVNQTMLGTAEVLLQGEKHSELVLRVASPGGLTEKALATLEARALAETVDSAVATVLGE